MMSPLFEIDLASLFFAMEIVIVSSMPIEESLLHLPVNNGSEVRDETVPRTTKDLNTLYLQRGMLDDLASLLGMDTNQEKAFQKLSEDLQKPGVKKPATGLPKCWNIEEIKAQLNLGKEISLEALVLLIFERYLRSEKEKNEYKEEKDSMFSTFITRYKIERSEENIPPTWKKDEIAKRQRQAQEHSTTMKSKKQIRSGKLSTKANNESIDNFDVDKAWNDLSREQKWKILFEYVRGETIPEPFSGIKKASDKLEAMNFRTPWEKAKAVKSLYDSLQGNISNYLSRQKTSIGTFHVVKDKCVADALQCL